MNPPRSIALRRLLLIAVLALLATACGRGLDDSLAGVTTSTAPETTTTTTIDSPDIVTTTTQPEPPPEPVTVWAPSEYVAAIETAATEFTAASGIAVEVLPLELAEIRQRAQAGFTGTDPPDAFVGEHVWLGELRAAGVAAPVGLDGRASEFVAVAADAFRASGELHGAPFSLGATVLFRNVDLAAEAPTGTSQIKEVCEALVAGGGTTTTTAADETTTTTTEADTTTTTAGDTATGGDFLLGRCLVLPVDDPLPGLTFLTAPGGYLVGRDAAGDWDPTDLGLATEAAINGAGFLAEVVQEGFVSGAPKADALAGFAAGVAPFLFAGPEARSQLGDVPIAASPLPVMGGNTPVPPVSVRGIYLNARSERLDAAGVLLRDHLVAEPAMAALTGVDELAPAYGAVAASLPEGEVDAVVLTSAERGEPVPAVAGVDRLLDAAAGAITAVLQPADGDDAPSIAEILATAAQAAAAALAG